MDIQIMTQMGIEQYQALLKLTLGVSLFVVMFLALRLLAKDKALSRTMDLASSDHDNDWVGAEALSVVGVITETHNIKTVQLQRLNKKIFPQFKGGQFLTFQIDKDPKTVRSYSISSSDCNRNTIQISVKKNQKGTGSEWIHSLTVGQTVMAYPPSGHFVDSGTKDTQRVYVAGGIGITPILSMTLSNLDAAKNHPMVLFYGARTIQDLAFHKLLQYLSTRHTNLGYHPILSKQNEATCDNGYLNLDFIKTKIGSVAKAEFYICGPDAMTDPLVIALLNEGVPEANIFTEKFITPAALQSSDIPERELTVTVKGQRYKYKGRQSILEFLEANGQDMPYACRTGVCGSCKCRTTGKVKMLTMAGLTTAEKAEGLTLACVAYPEADIEVH